MRCRYHGLNLSVVFREDCAEEKILRIRLLKDSVFTGSSVEQFSHVAADAGTEFGAVLDRTGGQSLGITFVREGEALVIKAISEGLVRKWNNCNPNQRIYVGGSIIDANSVCTKFVASKAKAAAESAQMHPCSRKAAKAAKATAQILSAQIAALAGEIRKNVVLKLRVFPSSSYRQGADDKEAVTLLVAISDNLCSFERSSKMRKTD